MQSTIKTSLLLGAVLTAVMLLSSCATGGAAVATDGYAPKSKVVPCKSGDTQVASASQCLQDDAACYEKGDGAWCTGPRGNVCPAGSFKIAAGGACPANTRCITVSDSLTCGISY